MCKQLGKNILLLCIYLFPQNYPFAIMCWALKTYSVFISNIKNIIKYILLYSGGSGSDDDELTWIIMPYTNYIYVSI